MAKTKRIPQELSRLFTLTAGPAPQVLDDPKGIAVFQPDFGMAVLCGKYRLCRRDRIEVQEYFFACAVPMNED
jgi:hypothetical protein